MGDQSDETRLTGDSDATRAWGGGDSTQADKRKKLRNRIQRPIKDIERNRYAVKESSHRPPIRG